MKRILTFSKLFLPAVIFSLVLIGAGIFGYATKKFNLGIDFQSGLIQEVQFAPSALYLSYSGSAAATVSMDSSTLHIVITGAGINNITHSFPFSEYRTIADLSRGLSAIDGLGVRTSLPGNAESRYLIQSAQRNSRLGSAAYAVHYLAPEAKEIPLEDVRTALLSLGEVSVQVLGDPADRKFMIRLNENENGGQAVSTELVMDTLESYFGKGEIALVSASFVGSRFSKNLTDQAGLLLAATLVLILIYASIRFKPQFAIGAVIAIIHDVLIMVGFIVWSRMEFNTTTIAAILTIVGYSINDTIVVFDRIRETKRLFPDDAFEAVLNRSLSETLGRTIITTFTTMLAVVSLYIFTTGSMKDFALALIVGMISGVYSTIFIASAFVNLWDKIAKNKKKKSAAVPQVSEA